VELDMFPDERQLYEFVFNEAQDTIREAFRDAISLNSKEYGHPRVFVESTTGA
jgi:hypothetical protein